MSSEVGARPLREIRWHRWRPHPVAAWMVRVLVVVGPIAVGFLAGLLWRQAVRVGDGTGARLAWIAGLVAVSIVAFLLSERMLRRLTPLPLLLRVGLAFPDRTPSRFGVALRAGSLHRLRRRVERGDFVGGDDAVAAGRVLALAAALNVHDRVTLGHSDRVRAYAEVIGREMHLDDDEIDRLRWAALLHDVGKLEVPYALLNKPGVLTPEEYAAVQTHAAAGAAMVEPVRSWLGPWTDAVGQHHEWWDGGGYPNGLTGAAISLAARIVAVADAFDLMTSTRSYRAAVSADEAREELVRCAGSQFDPEVVRALVAAGIGRPARWWGLPFLGGGVALLGQRSASVTGRTTTGAAAVAAAAAAAGLALGPLHGQLTVAVSPPVSTTTTTLPATTTTASAPATRPRATAPTTTSTTTTTTIPTTTTLGPVVTAAGPATTRPPVTAAPTTAATTPEPATTTPPAPPPTTEPEPPPVALATDATLVVVEDTVATGVVGTGAASRHAVVEDPTLASLTIAVDGRFVYAPLPDANGVDRFVYEACDGAGRCEQGGVDVTIEPAPDPPVVADDAVTVRPGELIAVDVLANDVDVDGDDLRLALGGPSVGTVSVSGGLLRFWLPFTTTAAEAVIPYTAVDSTGRSSTARVTIQIVPGPVLGLSRSPARAAPVPVSAAVASGAVFIFVANPGGATTVDFYLDDPGRTGAPFSTGTGPAFDLGGSAGSGAPVAVDVSALGAGSHTVTAVVNGPGGAEVLTATFRSF
jgi:HD-GYP domain-containing protein (c-di-GMP phosphodiesterase class II)